MLNNLPITSQQFGEYFPFTAARCPNVNLRQVGRRNTRYTCSKLEVMTGVVEVETERQVELTPNDGVADMHDKKTERINTEGM